MQESGHFAGATDLLPLPAFEAQIIQPLALSLYCLVYRIST